MELGRYLEVNWEREFSKEMDWSRFLSKNVVCEEDLNEFIMGFRTNMY